MYSQGLAMGRRTGAAPWSSAVQAVAMPHIGTLDEHEWDSLVSDSDFFNSHGWLASLDRALGPAEVLAVRGPAGLAAGCALWGGESAQGLFHLPDFFPDVPGPWGERFLWLGGRRSTHNELSCVTGARRLAVLTALMDAAVDLALRRGYRGVVVPYMPVAAALEIAHATGATVLLHSAEAVIDVPAGGLTQLMSCWRAHDRTQCRAERAAFARHGNRVEWVTIDESNEAQAARLIALNRARHGSLQGEPWMRAVFQGQRTSGVLRSAIAAVARRDGDIAALTVFYRFGDSLHARYFGSNYDANARDFRYFVLNYYEPIDYAARHGVRRYHLSTSSLWAKAHRGAQIAALAAVVLAPAGLLPDAGAVARHNRAFHDDLVRQFHGRLAAESRLVLS